MYKNIPQTKLSLTRMGVAIERKSASLSAAVLIPYAAATLVWQQFVSLRSITQLLK